MVESIDIGDAQILHRLLLDQLYPLLPLLYAWCASARSIQYRANLPLRDQRIEHSLVELPYSLGIALINVYRESAQFVDNLLICHLQHLVYFTFRSAILLQNRTNLLTIYLCILYGHLAHHVEVQFKHLTNLLVKSHLSESFLNLCFQRRITGDSSLLRMYSNSGTYHS